MATYSPNGPPPPPRPGGGSAMMRQMLAILVVVVAIIFLYRTFFSGGISNVFQSAKPVDLKYVPADFQPNLDEGATLAILAEPEKHRKEFDDLVYNFNVSLLYHVASRMGLADSLKRRLEPEYHKQHDFLKTMYFNDFVALKDTTANLYESWYNDNGNQAVEIFNEVAGKYTCFFVMQILATIIKSDNGRLYAKGKGVETPCGIAINEGLRPMVTRLQKKAEIIDFSASRGLLKEKVRKGIAELATYELRSRMGIDKTLQYKIFGLSISETDIRVEAISVVKAGFKLDQYFDVTFSPKKGEIYVKLPPPTILSHEVYPRVDKLDVGLLAGINEVEMNKNFNELRRQFRIEAIEQEHVLDKARLRADSVMQLMLGPMIKSINRNYKLVVRFEDGYQAPVTADERMRRGEDGNTSTPPPSQPSTQAPRPAGDAPRPKPKFIPQ